ncbi:MAG: DUF4129 domain-containing protein [Chloroflexota bacterium]|nr:DUF4129 domain-containing protein [Chloroflexota bacterium]
MDKLHYHARRELLFLALGAMDVCVITPLVAAFLSLIIPVRPLPITGTFLGAVLTAHYLARASLRSRIHSLPRSGLLGLGMLISGLLVVHQLLHAQTNLWDPAWLVGIMHGLRQENIPPDVLIFLLVLFLWWRGLVLAQRRLDSESVAFRFRLGLVMLAATVAVGGIIVPWPLHQFVFAFFFVSLLGIALARAEEVGLQYDGRQSPFGLGWLATLVAAILVVLLLAAGVGVLLTDVDINRFIDPVLDVLSILVTVLTYVLAWIVYGVTTLLHAIFGELDWGWLQGLPASLQPGPPTQPQQPLLTPDQLAIAKEVGTIGGVLLLLLLVAFSLRRLRVRGGWEQGEERESVWEGSLVGHGLHDLLRQGRRRLDEASTALSRFFAALTIRRIYAHLNALAAERGYPRAQHETPYEYLPILEQSFPDNREDIASITEAYVAAHYGEVPERLEDLETIRAAWKRIRQATVAESSQRQQAADSSVTDD